MFFLIVRNCSFSMGSIFCSSVALIWTFNTRVFYNFVTKKANIPVNLVPFFNGVLFLLCHYLLSGVTNELKSLLFWKSEKVRAIDLKQDKTLLLLKRFGQHMYGGRLQLHCFLKKSNIWARQPFQSNILYLKKWQCREHVTFPVNFNN